MTQPVLGSSAFGLPSFQAPADAQSGTSTATGSGGATSLGNTGQLNQSGGLLGMLGLGQYQVNPYQINANAYVNPVGNQAPNWNAAMGQYLAQNTAQAPMLGQTQLGMVTPGYGGQMAAAQQYQQLASGQGPSVAAQTAAQQQAQNYAQTLSMLGSARGSSNPAMAQYAAQNALAQGQQQAAQNAVAGRTQEQLGALQGMAGAYGQAAQTGLSAAQLQQQQGIQQANFAQQQQQLNQAAWNQYLAQLAAQNNQQFAANQNLQQLAVKQNLGAMDLANQAFQSQQQRI
ncbi:MAG: hypothetical protein FWD17_15690, partial [Polyangiaceae bacterium]|nr:hypothetical protein [Polyangiaceae bacterium]